MLFMEEIYGDEDQSGDRGTRCFWHEESFDHLVRTAEHFQAFRRYIADNPARAGLRQHEYLHWSRQ